MFFLLLFYYFIILLFYYFIILLFYYFIILLLFLFRAYKKIKKQKTIKKTLKEIKKYIKQSKKKKDEIIKKNQKNIVGTLCPHTPTWVLKTWRRHVCLKHEKGEKKGKPTKKKGGGIREKKE